MSNNPVLDTGYVIYFPDTHNYYTANVGIFKTKRNAEEQSKRYKLWRKCEVRKVKLVLVDEVEEVRAVA